MKSYETQDNFVENIALILEETTVDSKTFLLSF